MATPIKRIEKDFFLKILYDDQLPLTFLRNRTEYVLRIERPTDKEMFLLADRPIPGLQPRRRMHLIFGYNAKVITFAVEIKAIRENHIVAEAPEYLYKDLNRSHSRVVNPPDLKVQFSLKGDDRYALPFPKIADFESGELTNGIQNPPPDFNGLIVRMGTWVKELSGAYRLVLFKDKPPTTTEERILAGTGKTIFLPSPKDFLPRTDPNPKKRLVTEDMFKRYLESVGIGEKNINEAIARYIRSKTERGIFSEARVPLLFLEYVIGYIHVWKGKEDLPPLTKENLDTLYLFARSITASLKTNGYFAPGILTNKPFTGGMLDISASGLLFSYPSSDLTSAMLPDEELAVTLHTPKRTINAAARIARRFTDRTTNYFGCQFLDIAPEDIRFLFEFIYGKPFTDDDAEAAAIADAQFLSGRV
ncbi:hypothetical protein AGMMS49942_20450 [Spirochaetia bacterium]|nr:hypothetical protein AGMMS49942_20450 [Spirochaetia bacterium]